MAKVKKERRESNLVGKEPCPKCGSRDNLARYDDGHAHCFGQGCDYWEPGDGEFKGKVKDEAAATVAADLLSVEIPTEGLPVRGLTSETCNKWSYGTSLDKYGEGVQVAQFRNAAGQITGQKLRYRDKRGFPWVGKPKEATLFGAHLWGGGKKLVVTEGEIDAMSVSQLQGHRWPVVSVINGSSGAKRDLLKNLDYLENFEEIILMFDQDEPGQAAAKECAEALLPMRVRIASLPLKDANDMLLAKRGQEVVKAVWDARLYQPDGIVSLSDLRSKVLTPITIGLPWCLDRLTALTYGRRPGEVIGLGAGTGVGKTDLLTQQIEYDLNVLEEKVGIFFLEQPPEETAKRICGKGAGKLFHVPEAGWTREELEAAWDHLERSNRLYPYDHFGQCDWDVVERRIRYLAQVEGVRLFYIDHLTAFAAGHEDEKTVLERIMERMASLAKQLGIIIHFVSHLATPDGKPHEEGGRVMIRHFKGSRAIGFWSHILFGLERDQQASPELRQISTLRVLKERLTGQSVGQTIHIRYDPETGRLAECEPPSEFKDESGERHETDF